MNYRNDEQITMGLKLISSVKLGNKAITQDNGNLTTYTQSSQKKALYVIPNSTVVINITASCELTECYKLKVSKSQKYTELHMFRQLCIIKLQAVDQAIIKFWYLLAKGRSK